MIIHLIFNAHIDPVWLWPWQASLDEILATCRSACDRLDAHPALTFSRGEAWVYREIERLDPALFARIRRFVEQGRWEIVGGWWVQPDCNLPSGFAFEHQIGEGKRYFMDRFGAFPEVAYNVDSFGHAATLPGYLRAAGQRYYVMMRPQEHEMALPARLFRWRGYEGGPEVTVFRIPRGYCAREMSEDHVRASLEGLPPGVEETMCFVGVGDHGGGPTERQIAWLEEHWNAFEGHSLLYSTPARYFKAVEKHAAALPLVTGELQQHAVGCYSVGREMKTSLRRAEHLLDQAGRLLDRLDPLQRRDLPELTPAWEQVVFNQFHDTLGGTCIPSSYRQIYDQLGAAAAAADEVLQTGFRRTLVGRPKEALQRVAVHNPSPVDFEGCAECEPWRDGQPWTEQTHLVDAAGRSVSFQKTAAEAVLGGTAVLFPIKVESGQTVFVRVAETGEVPPVAAGVSATEAKLENNRGVAVDTASGWRLSMSGAAISPALQLFEEPTDTWSHGVRRYEGALTAEAKWEPANLVENGPLRAALVQTGNIGQSRLAAEWRVEAGGDFAELLLRVFWAEEHKLLKLTLPASGASRTDGIMGGSLMRPNDGRELPLRDWTFFEKDGERFGIVSPDTYAIDGDGATVRLTLLRSPLMAHHAPTPPVHPRKVVADQGWQHFRFRFFGRNAEPALLERHALTWQQPLLFADLTEGMPTRFNA